VEKVTKKQIARERSMERLTQAAFRLFVRTGYHATTLESIALDAKYTKGAVYFYFKSKKNLGLYLIQILRKEIVTPLVAAIQDTEGTVKDKVIAYIHRGANFGIERPYQLLFMILIAVEFAGQDDEISKGIRSLYAELHDALENAVREGQQNGTTSQEVAPREFASMVIAVHDGMMLEKHIRGDEIDGPELVRHVRKMLLKGIA